VLFAADFPKHAAFRPGFTGDKFMDFTSFEIVIRFRHDSGVSFIPGGDNLVVGLAVRWYPFAVADKPE
jgi:hypothetical protein